MIICMTEYNLLLHTIVTKPMFIWFRLNYNKITWNNMSCSDFMIFTFASINLVLFINYIY